MRRWLLIGTLVVGAVSSTPAVQVNPFLGAWNMTGTGPDAAYVYWLEVKQAADGTLSGMFLNRTSSPFALGIVKIDNGELVFQAGRPDRPTGPEYRARLDGGKLIGRHTLTTAARAATATEPARAAAERVVNWVGTRPPTFPPSDANARHSYGNPVVLFDGKTLDAFGGQNAGQPLNWSVVDGIAQNAPPANNLVSKETFTNFKIEAEYKLAEKSNGGIYLRGRYELQLLDDATDTTTRPDLTHMAIYGRTPPSVRASKPAGEWQRMEAVIVGNRVTVTLNGTRVHDNAVILGITGGALDNNELAPGPILIQGDHSQVWLRRVVVTPITTAK